MSALSEALARLADGQAWDTVVWAGVGHGSELAAVRELGAGRGIYLEPHPGLHASLQASMPLATGETLLSEALWRCAERRGFFHLSNPLRSSMLAPEPLLARLPNLTVVAHDPVDTLSLDDLAVRFALAEGRNLLILDACGAEGAVLAAASRDTLGLFSHLLVCQAPAIDYHGASTRSDVIGFMATRDFAMEPDTPAQEDANDPLLLRLDRGAWIQRTHQLALESLHTQVRTLTEQAIGYTQAQEESARLRMEVQGLREHAADLGRARDEHARIAVERLDALQAAEARTQDDARQCQGLRQQLEVLQSETVRWREQCARLKPQLAQAAAAHEAHVDAMRTQQARLEPLQQALDSRTAELETLQARVEAAERSAALSLKLQMLRDADLKDLQDRHAASLAMQDSQHQLLTKLGERMSMASQYFHQLTDQAARGPAPEPPTAQIRRRGRKSGDRQPAPAAANPTDTGAPLSPRQRRRLHPGP